MSFPRVLVVALARINNADTANNGLLLRNLFAPWPRENLAQIYSSGDNGDAGFFGSYYRLGPRDRRLGSLFYRLKKDGMEGSAPDAPENARAGASPAGKRSLKAFLARLAVDTGLHELVFRPRLSGEMLDWVRDFRPDIIFAQGYNLTFAELPVLLKQACGTRLAFLTTDDWPTYLYSGQLGEPRIFSWAVRPVVEKRTKRLMSAIDVPLAFGQPMADEYSRRYGREFITLSHADDPARFEEAAPIRSHPDGTCTILATGFFNRNRWPLLLDANECCRLLAEQGINARITVLSSGIDAEGASELAKAEFIDITEDPGNDRLPAFLKGADILLLAEGFDEGWVSAIGLSVSSKSHLFMFSCRPIIVYAHPNTGVSRYASTHGWAYVVGIRNVKELQSAITKILTDVDTVNSLLRQAGNVVNQFHTRKANQDRLLSALAI